MFKKSVFCPYLGQFLSDFENLWYRYDQKNEIFKLSTFTYWSDYYLKNRFLRPQSLSRPKLALIWLRGPKMPLKDWVTMIDLWLIVISIPCIQNKSACPPPLSCFWQDSRLHWLQKIKKLLKRLIIYKYFLI